MENMESIPGHARQGWGADADAAHRPGVPMVHPPEPVSGAHWSAPELQPHRELLETQRPPRDTPVFGTAQPLHGVSGFVRRRAYAIPEHRASHWMLLLMADRVEAYSHRLKGPALLWGIAGFGAVAALRRLRAPREERRRFVTA